MQIIFWFGAKCLGPSQCKNPFFVWHKNGPAQNILGPVEGQGITQKDWICTFSYVPKLNIISLIHSFQSKNLVWPDHRASSNCVQSYEIYFIQSFVSGEIAVEYNICALTVKVIINFFFVVLIFCKTNSGFFFHFQAKQCDKNLCAGVLLFQDLHIFTKFIM